MLTQPAWFLIDYAIGGISGWSIDMERYGNESDMWVDWVRVSCGRALPPDITVEGVATPERPARLLRLAGPRRHDSAVEVQVGSRVGQDWTAQDGTEGRLCRS